MPRLGSLIRSDTHALSSTDEHNTCFIPSSSSQLSSTDDLMYGGDAKVQAVIPVKEVVMPVSTHLYKHEVVMWA